jgi:hypothetical protein
MSTILCGHRLPIAGYGSTCDVVLTAGDAEAAATRSLAIKAIFYYIHIWIEIAYKVHPEREPTAALAACVYKP